MLIFILDLGSIIENKIKNSTSIKHAVVDELKIQIHLRVEFPSQHYIFHHSLQWRVNNDTLIPDKSKNHHVPFQSLKRANCVQHSQDSFPYMIPNHHTYYTKKRDENERRHFP